MRVRVLIFVVAAGSLLDASTTFTWTGGNPTPNVLPYPWSLAANWGGAGPPNASDALALFQVAGVTPPYIVDVNAIFTVSELSFNSASQYTLVPEIAGNGLIFSAGLTITFPNAQVAAGNHVINVPILLMNESRFDAAPGTSLRINQPLSEGVTGIVVDVNLENPGDSGNIYFAAPMAYTGTTSIYNGTLFLVDGGSIANSRELFLHGGNVTFFDISGISASSTTIQDLSGTLSGGDANRVNLGNKNLTFGTGNTTVYSGDIAGNLGSLTKQGSGTFTIASVTQATYSGPTTINQGTFIGQTNQSFSQNSDYVLNDSSTLTIGGTAPQILSLTGLLNTTTLNALTATAPLLQIINGGTFFGTISNGAGQLALLVGSNASPSLPLNLYGNNGYSGGTGLANNSTVGVGSSTALGTGLLSTSPGSTLLALTNVTLANDILLISGSINYQNYQMTLTGDITGSGTLSILGSSPGFLTLSGNNTYSAATVLANGVTVRAGSADAFSPNSSFLLQGASTLDLNGFNNSVNTLSSTTTAALVTNSGSDGALQIFSGGAYYGLITDGFTNTTALSLSGGLLTLLSPNTYSGDTTIATSELRALAANAFSPHSLVNLVNASSILNLNGFNNTIAGLEGAAGSSVTLGSNSTLTIYGDLITTFSGNITDTPCGSLTIDGGTQLTLDGTNSYCGATNIINGTLKIRASGALSPNSAVTVQSSGVFDLANSITNSAPSLTTSGNVSNTGTSILTLTTFTVTGGTVLNSTGLIRAGQTTISGGTFFNTAGSSLFGNGVGSSFSMTGGILSNGTTCTTTSCTLTTGCTSTTTQVGDTDTSFAFTGGLINTNGTILGSSYTQGADATLNLIMCSNLPSGRFGNIKANGAISLNGALVVTGPAGFSPANGTFFPLVSKPAATAGIPTFSGQFSSIQLQGFASAPSARIITAVPKIGTGAQVNVVTLYFAGCVSSWNSPLSGLWSDDTKWIPPCVPGITIPPAIPIATNDGAIFPNVGASAVAVSLTYINPLTPLQSFPISPVLLTMEFTANTTSYTINPFPAGGSKLIFDATPAFVGDAQILVDAGSHTINAPILLNIPTDLVLTDGAQITFGTGMTLQSGSATAGFLVAQGLSSTAGTGLLINQGALSPTFFTFESATIQNNQGGMITPINNFTMGPMSGHTAHLINSGMINPGADFVMQGDGSMLVDNSGTNASIGSSQPNRNFYLSGPGAIVINNSGTGAIFGGSGNGGNFLINSSGSVTINNIGVAALLGPTGAESQFVVNGTGPIFLNNTGESASLVASGAGALFELSSPSVTVLNQGLGVLMGAPGPKGNVIIQAGFIQNLLGAIFQAGDGGQLSMTGGTLINDLTSTIGSLSQDILFTGGSLTSSGAIYAFDYTQRDPASLTLTLTSVPTHGFVQATDKINLAGTLNIEALPGFSASSADVIVLLEGSLGRIGQFSTVNFSGFPSSLIPALYYFPTTVELLFAGSITPSPSGTATTVSLASVIEFNVLIGREMTLLHEWMYERYGQREVKDYCGENAEKSCAKEMCRKGEQLTKQACEKRERPWRVYMGPIGSIGTVDSVKSQPGYDYTSMGLFGGLDHAGSEVGLGVAVDYENMTGKLHHDAGHLHIHQIRANAYATLMMKSLPELSLMAIVGGGYDWYSLSRTAGPSSFPLNARSSPHGTEFDGFFGIEYIFAHKKYSAMPEGLHIVPMANVQYVGVSIDTFRENNAGVFSLRMDGQFRESLRSYLGARLDYTVGSCCCKLETELDLGWQREYLDHDFTLDAFTISALPARHLEIPVFGLGRDTFLGGIDLLLTVYESFQVEASYDLQWNSRLINNTVYLGIGGRF